MAQWKNRLRLLIIPLLLLLTAIHQDDVRADVGIPPAQPGSSLSPGDLITNVQMVSEEVEITILKETDTALISAIFQMRNNGTEDEEIDVWFPYGEKFPNSKGIKIIQARDFQAWVEDEKVDITIEKSDEWNLIWAHWKVRFPAGSPITIQVSYRVPPNRLEPPHYNFTYILETGAGWLGVIEKAEITINTPYSLQELDNLLGIGDVFSAQPSGYTVNPDRIVWIFENLEPTEDDNINFSPLSPNSWYAIHDSLITLENNPDDWEAHDELVDGLYTWKLNREWAEREGLVDSFTEMDRIIKMIGNSYLKVLDLSPPDVSRYSSALIYFSSYPQLIGGTQLQEMFNEALELFPEDEQLVWNYERALEKGLFEVDLIPESSTSTPPEISATAGATPDTGITAELPSEPISASFPLIVGMLFIGAAIVLMIIAIRRREKSDSITD